jgi:hypothetical protein
MAPSPTYLVHKPVHLSYFTEGDAAVYFLQRRVFTISLDMKWLGLSSTADPNDHPDHNPENFLLLERGDIVVSRGEPKGTAIAEDKACRVQVEVITFHKKRNPKPKLIVGWITLYSSGLKGGGNSGLRWHAEIKASESCARVSFPVLTGLPCVRTDDLSGLP